MLNMLIKLKYGLARIVYYLLNKPFYAEYHLSDFVIKPISITQKSVKLGKHVLIYYHARINGVRQYNDVKYSPEIILESGVRVQQNLHLTCAESVIIGENTAIAANVTITDIHHPYTDINVPIELQNIEVHPVKIGRDCKIYNNVVILPGTLIGDHVTIGANSVVNGTIPDYCVAVGAPAKIIKRYDFLSKTWKKTNVTGDFI